MKTLIELFDREPLVNVLGMLMMNPEHVIFLGDKTKTAPAAIA